MVGKKRLITPEQIEASKEHRRTWDRERHAKQKEKRNAARRDAHAANPERIRKIERERYKNNPDAKKRIDIISKYGRIGYVAYRYLENCESCGDKIEGKKKHIDHDHSLTRKHGFRGVLCSSCNLALGHLKEDEARILALANYIKRKRSITIMKTFTKCAAQGDLLIRRIESIPAGAVLALADKGKFVVAHSETGHNHVIDARPNVQLFTTGDPMISYLQVIEATDATETLLEHLRSYDTHETIKIAPGNYEIRRQREHTPEGWRRVED